MAYSPLRFTMDTRGNFLWRGIELGESRSSMCRLTEFCVLLPNSTQATSSSRKVLLKKLVARLLPPEFDQHCKQGFSIPLASWHQSESWQSFFREVLLGSDNALFNRKMLNKLLDGHAKGLSNGEWLFALVMFEL